MDNMTVVNICWCWILLLGIIIIALEILKAYVKRKFK